MTTEPSSQGRGGVRSLWRVLGDNRGAVATEYVILIAFAGLTAAVAIAGWLPQLLADNARQREVLSQPYP